MPSATTLTVTDPRQLTEAAAAAEFARRNFQMFKYNHTVRKWLHFTEGRWGECGTGEEHRAAKDLAADYAQAAADAMGAAGAREAFMFATRLASAAGVTSLLRSAQSEKSLAVTDAQFDIDTHLLNVKNGTIELASRGVTGANPFHFRPAHSADLMSLQANVSYDETAVCPQFRDFIEETFGGDLDLIQYVQRLLGSCLAGGNDEQVFPICWGGGGNGKSTLLNTIRALLGDYGQTLAGDALIQKRAGAPTNDIADLKGIRFAVATELPPNAKIDSALVKRLTGGDHVRGRRLYQNNEEFVPQATIFAAANSKPALPAADDAVWRRVHLIPFTHTVAPEDRDVDILKKLLAEGPGILNWLLDGYADYLRHGLNPPTAVLAATSEYRDELDLVKRFVEDACEVGPAFKEGALTVQLAFKRWCEENGETPVRAAQLKERLQSLGYEQKRLTGGFKYLGLRLRPEAYAQSSEDAA